jgi:hypothetical protein
MGNDSGEEASPYEYTMTSAGATEYTGLQEETLRDLVARDELIGCDQDGVLYLDGHILFDWIDAAKADQDETLEDALGGHADRRSTTERDWEVERVPYWRWVWRNRRSAYPIIREARDGNIVRVAKKHGMTVEEVRALDRNTERAYSRATSEWKAKQHDPGFAWPSTEEIPAEERRAILTSIAAHERFVGSGPTVQQLGATMGRAADADLASRVEALLQQGDIQRDQRGRLKVRTKVAS